MVPRVDEVRAALERLDGQPAPAKCRHQTERDGRLPHATGRSSNHDRPAARCHEVTGSGAHSTAMSARRRKESRYAPPFGCANWSMFAGTIPTAAHIRRALMTP